MLGTKTPPATASFETAGAAETAWGRVCEAAAPPPLATAELVVVVEMASEDSSPLSMRVAPKDVSTPLQSEAKMLPEKGLGPRLTMLARSFDLRYCCCSSWLWPLTCFLRELGSVYRLVHPTTSHL